MRHLLLDSTSTNSFHATEDTDECYCPDMCLSRVGIELPAVEIRYDHLSINADVFIGSRALPTLLNFTRDIVEVSTDDFCENKSVLEYCRI